MWENGIGKDEKRFKKTSQVISSWRKQARRERKTTLATATTKKKNPIIYQNQLYLLGIHVELLSSDGDLSGLLGLGVRLAEVHNKWDGRRKKTLL